MFSLLSIVIFTAFTSLAATGQMSAGSFLQIPVSIVLGICLGMAVGYGLVAFEALTLGKPCVVSNVGGLRNIVDSTCGELCNPNNIHEYINETEKLLLDKNYYNKKSKMAILLFLSIVPIFTDVLTMEDIDTYSMISGRISNEDLYSIVDTYFMPYGMECDLYNVMGEITDFSRVRNIATDERIYELRISCNDLDLDICINKNDF